MFCCSGLLRTRHWIQIFEGQNQWVNAIGGDLYPCLNGIPCFGIQVLKNEFYVLFAEGERRNIFFDFDTTF